MPISSIHVRKLWPAKKKKKDQKCSRLPSGPSENLTLAQFIGFMVNSGKLLRIKYLVSSHRISRTRAQCNKIHLTIGMDVKTLSSNWKKLQETLKRNPVSSSTKRKTSDREGQDGVVKKRKTEIVEGKTNLEQSRVPKKRKRMADSAADGDKDGIQETVVKTISRKNSTTSIAPRPEVKIAKVNEGRSPTLVSLLSLCHMFWFKPLLILC